MSPVGHVLTTRSMMPLSTLQINPAMEVYLAIRHQELAMETGFSLMESKHLVMVCPDMIVKAR